MTSQNSSNKIRLGAHYLKLVHRGARRIFSILASFLALEVLIAALSRPGVKLPCVQGGRAGGPRLATSALSGTQPGHPAFDRILGALPS